MPAKKKQASLKKTKSTTTYGRGGAKKKMYGGGAAKPMKKSVYKKGGAKKLKAQSGMNMEPGMNPTPNDVRTDRFINAMDNVDRGINRIFPGRPGRQRVRDIKRGAKQDARLNRSLNRINRDRGPRDINPEALPAANTRVPRQDRQRMREEYMRENMSPGDAGMPNPRPARVKSTQTEPSVLQQKSFKAYDDYMNQRQEGGLSGMFRDASKGAMGLNEMGHGGPVTNAKALRNNTRGKARKNR